MGTSIEPLDVDAYVPGAIVLAKVKGYPDWPSMLMDMKDVPEDVLAYKPKMLRADQKKILKPGDDGELVAVRFFSEPSHSWNVKSELKILTPQDAREWLDINSKKKQRNKSLALAYEIAASPPSYDDFVMGGEDEAAPEEGEEENVVDIESEEEQEEEEEEENEEQDNEDEEEEEEEDVEEREEDNGRAGSENIEMKDKSAAKSLKRKANEQIMPTSKQLGQTLAYHERVCRYARHHIQRFLLEKPQAEKMPDIHRIFNRLEDIPDLNMELVQKYRLPKVLRHVLRKNDIPREQEFRFHQRASAIMERWAQLGNTGNGHSRAR
ncbi:hypothetical protein TRVA0_048S01222 [Trichomonascus vanleenenianus]|uniref:uncharacterized protein n=1 Tax=Trichomonascus vanleenenianus TaxID=2268995 RepID=UPI003EC96F5B